MYPQLSAAGIEAIITQGHRASESVSALGIEHRAGVLRRCAQALRSARPKLIASLVLDGGKNVLDADSEVSEAVDFAEYYATHALEWFADETLHIAPRGLTVVTSPWNFPLAIPLGGVFAAFVMGNSVILKPSNGTPDGYFQ